MIKYPKQKIASETIPWIRKKPLDDQREIVEYTLTYEDVNSYPGNVLENLSFKFYGEPTLWYLIYELNAPIEPSEYSEGMVIQVPVTSSFRESPIITSTRQV